MHRNPEHEFTSETSRLLSELDRAIEQSGAICDILRRYQQLRELESITGPSPATRSLRREISDLEQRLHERREIPRSSA